MKSIVIVAIFCALGTIASWLAAGKSLGLLIGGLGFASLITSQFAVIQPRRRDVLSIILAATIGVGMVWIIALHEIVAIVILAAFLCAICGISWGLLRLRLHHTLAAAIAIVLAFTWMSWPMWWSGNQRLVDLNAIFNLNARVANLGIWTQQPIMYRLTTLGQDVAYQLPKSIWAFVIVHSAAVLLLLLPPVRGGISRDSLQVES